MGACSSGEEIEGQTRKMQQERISSSTMVALLCESPFDGPALSFEARELETVLVVLGRVAVNLGLDEEVGELLQMVFNENVVPHNMTVQTAGLLNGSCFGINLEGLDAHVKGINMVEMRRTDLTDEECVAAGFAPGTGAHTQHWGEYTKGVKLVCEWAPARVNSDKDKVSRIEL